MSPAVQPTPDLQTGKGGSVRDILGVNINIVMGSALAALAVLIGVVLVIIFVLKRRSHARRHVVSTNQQPVLGFDNVIYNVTGLPPSYAIAIKDDVKEQPCPSYDNATNNALSDPGISQI